MKMTTEMTDWLQDIVSKEPWDEEELADWAGEFLADYYDEHESWERRMEQYMREEQAAISRLKLQVAPYLLDPALPPLPYSPHGQLHGIGFIYDADRDDRILIAIDELRHNGDIIAVGEHEGELTIFTRNGGVAQRSIEVYGDTWTIRLFLPSDGRWCEVRHKWLDFDLSEFQK